MTIYTDIHLRVDEQEARRAARQIHDTFQREAAHTGQGWGDQFNRGMQSSQMQAGMRQVAAAQESVNTSIRRGTADVNVYRDAHGRLRDELGRFVAENRRVTIEIDRQGAALTSLGQATRSTSGAISAFIEGMKESGAALSGISRAFTPIAIVGVGAALVEVAGVAASAAQSLWLLPAAATAAGAGIGTLALGLSSFGKAMEDIRDPKKFAEDLASMAPAAQQAAMHIQQAILPVFDEIRRATETSLFAAVPETLTNLTNTFGPTIQNLTTGIGGAFNQAFQMMSQTLMSPEVQANVLSTVNNIVAAFQNLAPAIVPLTQAFAQITEVGSGFLPQLANAATQAANAFGSFIQNAAATGQLQDWLSRGLTTMGQLVELGWELGEAFMALAPIGEAILPVIVELLEDINEIIPIIGGAALLLGPSFGTWITAVQQVSTAFQGVQTVVEGVANAIIPQINAIREHVGQLALTLMPILRVTDALGMTNIGDFQMPALPNLELGGGGGGAMPTPGMFIPGGPLGQQLQPQAGGFGNAQRERRGLAPVPTGPTTGLLPPGNVAMPPPGGYQMPITTLPGGAGGPNASGMRPIPKSRFSDQNLQPNAARLNDIIAAVFPQVKEIGGWRASDPYPDHPSGRALDIMIPGGNMALGDEINQFLLQNAGALGLDQTLWRQSSWKPGAGPRPMSDRGSPTQNHMDHIHALVRAGQAVMSGQMVMPGPAGSGQISSYTDTETETGIPHGRGGSIYATTPVTVESFGTSAAGQLSQIGAPLDQDMGMSRGLPGLMENVTRMLANLAFAPAIGALGGVAAAAGPQPGAGLLGMAGLGGGLGAGFGGARGGGGMGFGAGGTGGGLLGAITGMGGAPQAMGPAPLGGGLGAQLGTPASGTGMGPPPGPQSLIPGQQSAGTPGNGAGFAGVGGMPLAAAKGAASALNAVAPGAGMAAQVGIDLLNRTAAYGGQVAGILASGALETMTLSGSGPMTDPLKTLPGRLIAGFAGARPAQPNTAGMAAQAGQPQQDPNTKQHGQAGGAAPGPGGRQSPLVQIENYNAQKGEQAAGRHLAYEMRPYELSSGFAR